MREYQYSPTMFNREIAFIGVVILCACLSPIAMTDANISTTTPSTVDQACSALSSSCGNCLANSKCFYCTNNASCLPYPNEIYPSSSVCPTNDVFFLTCTVPWQGMLIMFGVLGGIVLLTVTGVCVYCCCCRRRRGMSRREAQEEQQQSAEYEERRSRNAERRAERQARWDEIRRKYGLSSGSTAASYNRFENDPEL